MGKALGSPRYQPPKAIPVRGLSLWESPHAHTRGPVHVPFVFSSVTLVWATRGPEKDVKGCWLVGFFA